MGRRSQSRPLSRSFFCAASAWGRVSPESRLRSSSQNEPVQHFCAKHGFHSVDQEEVGGRTLDILEKKIGFSPAPSLL